MEINFGKQTISPDTLVKQLALDQQIESHLESTAFEQEIPDAADDEGISVSDREVQNVADSYRKSLGLHDASSTQDFLDRFSLTLDDFSDYCERRALESALKSELFDEDKVEQYFVNNRAEFEKAQLSIIDVDREPMANELKMQVEQEGANFHQLAEEYSNHPNRFKGGSLGLIGRDGVDDSLEGKIFNAEPGEVVGPVEKADQYRLTLVENHLEPELNDDVRGVIRDKLYREYMMSRIT